MSDQSPIEDLEVQKLNLEIAELKRPWYRRPGVILGVISTTLALAGVAGQNYLSKIEAVEAEAAVREADQKVSKLETQEQSLEQRIEILKESLKTTREREKNSALVAVPSDDEAKVLDARKARILQDILALENQLAVRREEINANSELSLIPTSSRPEIHSKHFFFGYPYGAPATNDMIIRSIYALSSNDETKFADWVSYQLDPG